MFLLLELHNHTFLMTSHLQQKWRGLLHHVTNKHEWTLGGGTTSTSCDHGELPPCDNQLVAGSPPHVALAKHCHGCEIYEKFSLLHKL